MKLLRASKTRLTFRLSPREHHLFLQVLQLYPCIPPAHQRLSKAPATGKLQESQRLLDEALAEQRAAHKQQIEALLNDPRYFTQVEKDWCLSISRADGEWLLQIFNDIRVGSWVNLGSPEDIHSALNEKSAPDFWAMELAGLFQVHLLEALKHGA